MAMQMNDQVEARLAKLAAIRALGVNPYPYHFEPTHNSDQLRAEQEKLVAAATEVRWAGRIVRFNRRGKMAFMHLKDQTGRLQVLVAKGEVAELEYEVVKLLDIGDWIGVAGTMLVTQSGEYTLHAKSCTLLSKSVQPLPTPKEKIDENGNKVVFDQFKDQELRYRQRYLDLVLNDDVRETFRKRTLIVNEVRKYLVEQGYMEVDTPTLQAVYGGANARPFTTHHNAADIDLYLRVSNELYLKQLVIGGFERVFEFSRNFRNEGMDKTHNPEFSLLEFYQSYADYNDMMVHFETIYERACIAANGSTKVDFNGTVIDFKAPWRRLTVYDGLKEYGGLDVKAMSDDELKVAMKKHHVQLDGHWMRGRAILGLFEEIVEPNLVQPTFAMDFPKESTPLCKGHRTDPDLVEQFEPYINCWEVGNAYSELNDPIRQRQMLEEQVERGRGGEDETHPLDEVFLHAVECGMPPLGGCGIGIDRMIMLLTGSSSIRDVLLFPLMKPEA
jgi:lysyl-tRNA synthetase class 2